MKPVRADFVPRSPVPRGWWFAVAALVAAAVVLAFLTRQAALRVEAAQADEAALRAASAVAQARTIRVLPPPAYEASARELLAQHTVPWPTLFAALEAVQVTGVRVLSVDYASIDAGARVEVAFTLQTQVLGYVNELNAGVPASGEAWRWSVLRIEQSGRDGAGRALLMGRSAQR